MTEVRRLRKERGLTQAQLASKSNISIATIVRMEATQEKRKGGISIAAASEVAHALDVDIATLFPNMVLNYTQGRPVKTGGELTPTQPIRIVATCSDCGQLVSVKERMNGESECCEAKLAA